MTGQINAQALQLGFSNAQTLGEKFGVPAIVFGLVQTVVLFGLYRGILKRERAQHAEHEKHEREHARKKAEKAAKAAAANQTA
jgi:hypothetical protein